MWSGMCVTSLILVAEHDSSMVPDSANSGHNARSIRHPPHSLASPVEASRVAPVGRAPRAQWKKKNLRNKLVEPQKTRTRFLDLLKRHRQKYKPHRTTSQNGRNTTVGLPPPWQILAYSWPKIMPWKKWSNQNGWQDPAPNMDERRGAVQRFDRLWASLPDRLCYFSITSSST